MYEELFSDNHIKIMSWDNFNKAKPGMEDPKPDRVSFRAEI